MAEYRMLGFDDFLKLGYTEDEIIQETLDIAIATMDGLEDDPDLLGNLNKWKALTINSKDTFCALEHGGKMVGYFFAPPLTKLDFIKCKLGIIDENKIKVKKMIKPGKYKIYIAAVAILKEHRNAKNLSMFLDEFFSRILKLSHRGIILADWIANAYTTEGESFSKMLDMKFIKNHKSEGKMYYRKFYPIDKENGFNKKYPKVMDAYLRAQFKN